MDRTEKAAAVAELNRTFSEVGVVVVTRNLGMSVAQSTDLRTKMREAGAKDLSPSRQGIKPEAGTCCLGRKPGPAKPVGQRRAFSRPGAQVN